MDGLEIEISGDLTKRLDVIGGYAHMKTRSRGARWWLDGKQRGVPSTSFSSLRAMTWRTARPRLQRARRSGLPKLALGHRPNTYRVPEHPL